MSNGGSSDGAKKNKNQEVYMQKERYEGIDGLKAYAIIGIAIMHVLANGEYGLQGFVFEQLIPSFPDLVLLFLVISGFGMCCGYYQKIIDQKISIEDLKRDIAKFGHTLRCFVYWILQFPQAKSH